MKTFDDIYLSNGGHQDQANGTCAMEAVSWMAGEQHTDHPQTACDIVASFTRNLNDSRWPSDAARTEALKPLLPLFLGTRLQPGESDKARDRRFAALRDGVRRNVVPVAALALAATMAAGPDRDALVNAAMLAHTGGNMSGLDSWSRGPIIGDRAAHLALAIQCAHPSEAASRCSVVTPLALLASIDVAKMALAVT